MSVSSRQRIIRALDHQPTDRPPADLGSTVNTSITRIAYERLRKHLGLPPSSGLRYLSRAFQVVAPEEDVLERLHIDTRGLQLNPPDADRSSSLPAGRFQDEWGQIYAPAAGESGEILYFEAVHFPLAGAAAVRDIERFPWPDPIDPGRTRGLREKACSIRESSGCALVGHMGDTGIFQKATMLRGMEQFLVDMLAEPELAEALLWKVHEIQSRKMERYLEEVGEYLDVVGIGDDLAGQSGPLISLDLFRRMVKPLFASYFALVKKKTRARLHLHSCGAVQYYLDDLIEIGVDVINPVQISAAGMDPVFLKKRYGGRICFWGGVDTQELLPRGTPQDVARETRRIAGILGRGGGYVLNPVHNIQPDVPPENIVAMYDALL
jgi:uroporphyrinogen decarboxylase